MKTIPYILSALMCAIIGMLTACSSKTDEPANFTEVGQPASIYPDYKDIHSTQYRSVELSGPYTR